MSVSQAYKPYDSVGKVNVNASDDTVKPRYQNFNRQYRLIAGHAGQTGFEVGHKSASQPYPLHISFSFQKSDLKTQNTGKISIWNLSHEHIAVLSQKDCYLALRAGYNSHMPLIFSGIISFSSTVQDGADRRTDIEVIDSLVEIRDTFVSLSFSGTINWKTIFDYVATQMGVAICYSYNAKFAVVHNGFTFVGKARDVLTKGCKCCGLSWSIQNGVIQVKRANDVMNPEAFLLSSSSGLIGVPTQVVVSEDEATGTNTVGWDVEYFLNGAINIDDYIKLETKDVSGYFRVYSLEIEGDNQTGDWICKARLLEVK